MCIYTETFDLAMLQHQIHSVVSKVHTYIFVTQTMKQQKSNNKNKTPNGRKVNCMLPKDTEINEDFGNSASWRELRI